MRVHIRKGHRSMYGKASAAIMVGPNRPLQVETIDLDDPGFGEVVVRLRASGVCHSDISFLEGKWPAPLPYILGHEGAGTIEAVGPGVSSRRVGENVVLTFVPGCGRCRFCLEGRINLCTEAAWCLDEGTLPDGTTRYRWQRDTVYFLGQVGSFSTHAVVPSSVALKVPDELDPIEGCLLGCGVMTGVAAVTGLANVRPGDSVAIFGCGGVGLSAIQGARLVGADPIIAVDLLPEKRKMAKQLGATHVVDARAVDPIEAIRDLTQGGADFTFEASGNPLVAEQSVLSARTGGTTVLIGQPAVGKTMQVNVFDVTQFEHYILGTHIGGATPAIVIPRLARLALRGLIDLKSLVTHRLPLSDVNEAIAIAKSGGAGRVVLEL